MLLSSYLKWTFSPDYFSWLRDWEEWMTGKCWISNWTNIWVDWQLVSQIYMSGCFLFSLLKYTIVCVLYIKYIYHVTFMSDDCDSSIKWNNWQVKIKNFELLKDTEVEYSIHYNRIYKKNIILIHHFNAKEKPISFSILILFYLYKENSKIPWTAFNQNAINVN